MAKVTFEMMPCPVCGKPMPKKRLELGYNYCVNCSTEGRKVCIVEGTPEGDGNQEEVIIMTAQEARALTGYRTGEPKLDLLEDETSPDMQTFEDREITEELLNRKDRAILEGEFGYELSDRVSRDLETTGIVPEDELEASFPGLNEDE